MEKPFHRLFIADNDSIHRYALSDNHMFAYRFQPTMEVYKFEVFDFHSLEEYRETIAYNNLRTMPVDLSIDLISEMSRDFSDKQIICNSPAEYEFYIRTFVNRVVQQEGV